MNLEREGERNELSNEFREGGRDEFREGGRKGERVTK